MNSLVVYDSQFGNTGKIARAIAAGILGEIERAKSWLRRDKAMKPK